MKADDETAKLEQTSAAGERILADLCGPFPTAPGMADTLMVSVP